MNRGRIVLLVLLVAALGYIVYKRVLPQVQSHLARASQQAAQAAPTPAPPPFSQNAILADGSFNPIPPHKIQPSEDPATLVAADPWRAKYQPLLDKLQPPADSPGFYVYSFLDRTPKGVGLEFTYGWHLVGSAALARWTNARLAGNATPEHYGLPMIKPESAETTPTLAQWAQKALADPATHEARYVLVGGYDYDSAHQQEMLEVRLLDRQAPGDANGTVIYSDTAAGLQTFDQLAEAQRKAARAVAQKLVDQGITQSRPTPQIQGLVLNDELRGIAQLLDIGDSWAVMDGVDRALQLSVLFPDSTAPLQAAAYGLTELTWALGTYGVDGGDAINNDSFVPDWILRVYALAQIALATDPKPAISRINGSIPSFWSLRLTAYSSGVAPGPISLGALPELNAYYRALVNTFDAGAAIRSNEAPEWLTLREENRESWFIGNSILRGFYNERMAFWQTHDFYFRGMLIQAWNNSYTENPTGDPFALAQEFALKSSRMTLSSAWAALLATEGQSKTVEPAIEPTWKILAGSDAAKVKTAAEAGDYYALRALAMNSTQYWGAPYDAQDPSYRLLAAMEKPAQTIFTDAKLNHAASGYLEFEWTPAARLQTMRLNDYQGTFFVAHNEANNRGVYDALQPIVTRYFSIRPDNPAAQRKYISLVDHTPHGKDWDKLHKAAALTYYQLNPLKYGVYAELADIYFDEANPQKAIEFLGDSLRLEPTNPDIMRSVGETYRGNGYHAKAVEYLEKYFEAEPSRYDVEQEWAQSMCQLGKWQDPKVRQAFAYPRTQLPGNGEFQRNYLDYLIDWVNEYPEARKVADEFYTVNLRQNANNAYYINNAASYCYRVELADGNTTGALAMLKRFTNNNLTGIGLSSFNAEMAMHYIKLGKLNLAKEQLAKGIDEWQGAAISALCELAFAEKKYDESIAQAERGLQRYEFNVGYIHPIIRALDKSNRQTEARDRLLKELTEAQDPSKYLLIPEILSHLAAEHDYKKMDGYLEALLHSSYRDRANVDDSLDAYRPSDKPFADAVWAHINDIMAAPDYVLPSHATAATTATTPVAAIPKATPTPAPKATPGNGSRSNN